MTTRRRRSQDVGASEFDEQALSGSSEERSPPSPPPRQTSIRSSRRTNETGSASQVRVSTRSAGPAQRSGRARRPTPVARRRRRVAANQADSDLSAEEEEEGDEEAAAEAGAEGNRSRRGRQARGERQNNGRVRGAQLTMTTTGTNLPANQNELSWYERLMPEFVLNMTAPITGYESRLESDIEDEEYEILERERLRRNRRVRRRLLTLVLLATAASVFMYTRGRIGQRVGVKAAVSSMKHRLEEGLAKSIHDTMGK